MKDQELDNCSFVKTILMLCVVFYHSCAFWYGNWFSIISPSVKADDFFVWLTSFIGCFQIHTFTLVSGYIFFALKYELGKYTEFKPFLKNKLNRLIVPYYVVSLFWNIPHDIFFFGFRHKKILKYFFGINPGQLWFLWMLFWCFIVSWLLFEKIRKLEYNYSVIFIFMGCIYFLGCYLKLRLPNIFGIWHFLQFLPFFVLGMKIRQNSIKLEKLLVFFFLYVGVFFVMKLYPLKNYVIITVVNYFLFVLGALSAFCILQKISNLLWFRNIKNSHFFERISCYSFAIYLFHQQFIYYSIYYLNQYCITPIVHAIINFVFAMLGSFVLCSLISKKLKNNISLR